MSGAVFRSGILLLSLWASGCAKPPASPLVLDVDGGVHAPLQVAPGAVHVLVFISHECPIANSYAPTLRELAARTQDRPVRWFLVHVAPDLAAAAAANHRRDYELPGTVLLDPEHQLAGPLGVQRTPEAVVRTAAGTVYRGRIDDQWAALGARASAPSQQDLAAAIDAALAGRPVPEPHPPAVGCLLPEPARR